ncbi:MAG: hypothetical protein M1813_007949 [Trichoglossum hirsutum]|nr:MAG: hypothetical protein M1813_007949 [Trichoglossum hirsutum]
MRPRLFILPLLAVVLSVISTTFVLLALTSKKWAVQRYYHTPTQSATSWLDPVCVAHRSPFYRCGIPTVTFDANKNITTCVVPGCQFYKAYGWDKTSCRLPVETGDEGSELNGGAMECQEVHYAGNLQIASSFFITLGLIVTLTLAAVSILSVSRTSESEAAPRPYPFIHPLVSFLLFCLYVGALLQFIAQFFGVLAFTINATPTPDQTRQKNGDDFGVNEWVIDKALSAYATVAWTSAVACALVVASGYRRSKFEKLM